MVDQVFLFEYKSTFFPILKLMFSLLLYMIHCWITVWVSQQGLIDIRGILQSVTKKELVRFSVYIIEKITSRSNRIQHQKTTVIVGIILL